ncbi:hypothetical protein D3C75_905150 [compost metagenome]
MACRVICARSFSSCRALAKAWRWANSLLERRQAMAIRNIAVSRLVISSTRSSMREPSPKASLNALAAGVTPSLMATMRAFQSLTVSASTGPSAKRWRISPASTSSLAR